jgi:hypothetical protein
VSKKRALSPGPTSTLAIRPNRAHHLQVEAYLAPCA